MDKITCERVTYVCEDFLEIYLSRDRNTPNRWYIGFEIGKMFGILGEMLVNRMIDANEYLGLSDWANDLYK